jgi:hypothetical protein
MLLQIAAVAFRKLKCSLHQFARRAFNVGLIVPRCKFPMFNSLRCCAAPPNATAFFKTRYVGKKDLDEQLVVISRLLQAFVFAICLPEMMLTMTNKEPLLWCGIPTL